MNDEITNKKKIYIRDEQERIIEVILVCITDQMLNKFKVYWKHGRNILEVVQY